MNPFLDQIQRSTNDTVQTLLSVVKIAFFSKLNVPVDSDFKNRRELVVLGNGPSLNQTVSDHADFLSEKTKMAVNYAAISELYEQLKPEIYLIADPLFWQSKEVTDRLFGAMAQKTSWPMVLYMPARSRKIPYWQQLILANTNIKTRLYNTTPVEGFGWFTYPVYKKGWGMPRPHNVIIPCIMQGLRMPFTELYLAGVEHSWLKDIYVSDDNRVYMDMKHFYADEQKRVQSQNFNSAPSRLHQILYHMYVVFKGYLTIDAFARKQNKRIFNITPGSYIDAFERKTLLSGSTKKEENRHVR